MAFPGRRRWAAGLAVLAVACGPQAAGDAGGGAPATGSTSLATSSSGVDATTTPSDGTGTGTTTGTGGGEDDDGSPFIVPPDAGAAACPLGEAPPQPPTCDDGVRQAGELCYRSVASNYAAAEGTRLVDFGAGPRVLFVALGEGVVITPATAQGLQAGAELLDLPNASDLAVVDVDDDGVLDLVVSLDDADEDTIMTLRGTGDGGLEPWTEQPLAVLHHLQPGDLDGDANVDLIGTTDRYYGLGDVRVAAGLGGGAWAAAGELALGADAWFVGGDLDGDGLDDLVVLTTSFDRVPPRELRVHLNDGGGFVPGAVLATGDTISRAVLGHFDADAHLDVAYHEDGELQLRPGLGDGSFADTPTRPWSDYPLAAGDLDGDGLDEVIAGASVFAPTTDEAWTFARGCDTYAPKLASALDVDGDGQRDLVISSSYGQNAGSITLVLSNP